MQMSGVIGCACRRESKACEHAGRRVSNGAKISKCITYCMPSSKYQKVSYVPGCYVLRSRLVVPKLGQGSSVPPRVRVLCGPMAYMSVPYGVQSALRVWNLGATTLHNTHVRHRPRTGRNAQMESLQITSRQAKSGMTLCGVVTFYKAHLDAQRIVLDTLGHS